jgi:phage shock protein C
MDEHSTDPTTAPTTDSPAGGEPASSHTPPADGPEATTAEPADSHTPPAATTPPAAYPPPAGNYAPPAADLPPTGTRRTPLRLHRSRDERMVAGVCGGLAETLGIDAVILRLALVLATVLGAGAGVILYVACWILMPGDPESGPTTTPGVLVPARDVTAEPVPRAY